RDSSDSLLQASADLTEAAGQIKATCESVGESMVADARLAVDSAVEAAAKADQGNKVFTEFLGGVAALTETVQNASDMMKALSESSGQIGSIVETIAGIAGQTNLLALNASVEAARAGDAGRGFAVVAGEVRNLAKRSGQETKEISDLIDRIQGQTDRVVKSMRAGADLANDQTSRIAEAQTTYREIQEFFDKVVDRIRDIERVAKDLAASASEVSTSMNYADEEARRRASTASNLVRSARELQSLSSQMSEVVLRFKVPEDRGALQAA
ncbi:MAG TPA: methyl-accepting chemotaxis protein, partial [Fimbriimonadaceae bacterium]|nr:methyl-accepting chemotaxis protein [Fimbriimonadaceae bacterium]